MYSFKTGYGCRNIYKDAKSAASSEIVVEQSNRHSTSSSYNVAEGHGGYQGTRLDVVPSPRGSIWLPKTIDNLTNGKSSLGTVHGDDAHVHDKNEVHNAPAAAPIAYLSHDQVLRKEHSGV